MVKANQNLHRARQVKDDEFYTQLSDIEKELVNYRSYFKDKVVFCNCDDPESSNFWKYFENNFHFLGLKKLITTHFDSKQPTYRLEMTSEGVTKIPLKQNGDFRSSESMAILMNEADVVVTNPPFSLFREFISVLVASGKGFIVIGSKNAITYKEVFKFISKNQVWLGVNPVKEFVRPDGSTQKFGNIGWFTNLNHKRRHESLTLFMEYSPDLYPKYDNYDAIEVSRLSDIPVGYEGAMGVPITFLDKYNPNDYEILGIDRELTEKETGKVSRFFLGGKEVYARIVIRKRT